jgi:MFS family permease
MRRLAVTRTIPRQQTGEAGVPKETDVMQTQAIAQGPLQSAIRKARLRLTPFLALMFALSMLDRSNVGFVKQALETDSNIGNAAFALGAGIFFIGYAVFEIPSNLILHRVGAKIWLSRIMITWGLASAAMMFAYNETAFYVLRFILGVAESSIARTGFLPANAARRSASTTSACR